MGVRSEWVSVKACGIGVGEGGGVKTSWFPTTLPLNGLHGHVVPKLERIRTYREASKHPAPFSVEVRHNHFKVHTSL